MRPAMMIPVTGLTLRSAAVMARALDKSSGEDYLPLGVDVIPDPDPIRGKTWVERRIVAA